MDSNVEETIPYFSRESDCTQLSENRIHTIVDKEDLCFRNGKTVKKYFFDKAFGRRSNQQTIFGTVCYPLIGGLVDGKSFSAIAMGTQHGGRTFTIFGGDPDNHADKTKYGLIQKTAEVLFSKYNNPAIRFRISCIDIQKNNVFDSFDFGSPIIRTTNSPLYSFFNLLKSFVIQDLESINAIISLLYLTRRLRSDTTTVFTIYVDTMRGEEIVHTGRAQFVDFARFNALNMEILESLVTMVCRKEHNVRETNLSNILNEIISTSDANQIIVNYVPVKELWEDIKDVFDFVDYLQDH